MSSLTMTILTSILKESAHSHPRVYHFQRPMHYKMRIDLGCPLIIFSLNTDGEYRLETAGKIHP